EATDAELVEEQADDALCGVGDGDAEEQQARRDENGEAGFIRLNQQEEENQRSRAEDVIFGQRAEEQVCGGGAEQNGEKEGVGLGVCSAFDEEPNHENAQ